MYRRRNRAPTRKKSLQKRDVDVEVNERIEEQLNTNPIILYMKGTPDFPQCGFSGQAVAALNAVGKPFSYVGQFE